MQTDLPKKYLTYPKSQVKVSKLEKISHLVKGVFLFPFYWCMAYIVNTPGLMLRKYFLFVGIRFFIKMHDFRHAYYLIVSPLDTLRYFEFDFMWQSVRNMKIHSYLDVSSPRLFPLMLIDRAQNIVADLINPDKRDLAETIEMARSLGLADKCRFYPDLIGDVSLKSNSFDLITSMSVIEHISDDNAALRKIWDLLKPGGRLLITVPCAAEAYEEYMNRNDYELDRPDENGYVFFQRFYDEKLIQKRIFSVTGKPNRYRIYGEKQAGNYQKTETEKRINPFYPFWRTPFAMGLQYEYKDNLYELSGIGVIAFEFLKQ